MTLPIALLVLVVLGQGGAASAPRPTGDEYGVVRVTAARANIRQEPNDRSAVLKQVTAGTDLTLKAIEGDWFLIQMPPEPRLAGLRIDAYISKKVAKLVSMPTPQAAAAPVPPSVRRDAMSVALQKGSETTWLTEDTARLRVVAERADSVRALAGTLPVDDPPAPAGDAQTTFAWTIAGGTSTFAPGDRRPTFLVQFKAVPGWEPADLVPVLVRVAPALSGVRILGVVRGPADLATRTSEDWDLMRDLKQDVIRTTIEMPEPGAALLKPGADLETGEYAVVLRPSGRKKVSGASTLTGALFSTAWTFTIR